MANEEHVEIVKQGRDAIYAYRKANPDVRLDLIEANLIEANLTGADLNGADLNEAHLSWAKLNEAKLIGAKLIGAKLNEANLIGANLSRANLSRAHLSWADLSGANLSRAKLRGADLYMADLHMANLHGADFKEVHLWGTIFADVDLSTANGLAEIGNFGPCTIGIDTLYRSKGKIPDVFLRGCGVPDDLITYIPSLVGKPFEFYSCFISYSHANEEFAQRLHSRMQQEKLRVWFAPEDIQAGKKLRRQIDEAIRIHDKLLLVLTPESMESDWVESEIRWARKAEERDKCQKLFPVRLVEMEAVEEWECFDTDTGKDLAVEVREYHIPDFTNWKEHDAFEESFARLLNDLRKSEEKSDSTEP